jgi:hypothetical protein
MKIVLGLLFFHIVSTFTAFSQHIAVSADKNNVFYVGVDNPITVVAENYACKDLVVKADDGEILQGYGCTFICHAYKTGRKDIIIYKKTGDKLQEIGRSFFRVKNIPPPSFRIGPYGNNLYGEALIKISKVVIAAQQYVRADLDNFDFDVRFAIDSFHVTIFSTDSCKTKTFFNESNKISQPIRDAFSLLRKDDTAIFHKIYTKGLDGAVLQLAPLVLTIDN